MSKTRTATTNLRVGAVFAGAIALAAAAAPAKATSPPVGALPAGPSSSVVTQRGQLVAVALPHRANGRAWRIAKLTNAKVLSQVSEADVGANVVVVFSAARAGTAKVVFALTRGELPKVYESRTWVVRVKG